MSYLHPSATSLLTRFLAAHLPLDVARSSFTGSPDIFGMDIVRGGKKSAERFLIWPGHRDNRVEVQGIDRKISQLVLTVVEPKRRFERHVSRHADLPLGVRVIRDNKHGRVIEQWTSDRKRHFLCGLDEQHLFVAQLSRPVSAVAAAHQSLKPPAVVNAEGRGDKVLRQGEWFFLEPSRDERAALENLVRANPTRVRRQSGIAQAAQLSRRGRPHVADQVFVAPGEGIYVRGEVKHPDHRTVYFDGWRRVWPNLESTEGVIAGMEWID